MRLRGGLSLALMLVACPGTTKPPPLAQVPIGESTTSANNPPDDPTPSDTSGALPVDAPRDAGPADSGGFGKKALSEAECKKAVKKFADFVAKDAHQAQTAIGDLDSHPVYGQMLSQCQQEFSKKQYTCAMASRNRTGWEACVK